MLDSYGIHHVSTCEVEHHRMPQVWKSIPEKWGGMLTWLAKFERQ